MRISKTFQFTVLSFSYVGKVQLLLKAFDCIDHILLIVKLYCYGVYPEVVKIIYSYLLIDLFYECEESDITNDADNLLLLCC